MSIAPLLKNLALHRQNRWKNYNQPDNWCLKTVDHNEATFPLLIKNADYGALIFPFLSVSLFPFILPFFLHDMKETYLPSSMLILDLWHYFKVVGNVMGEKRRVGLEVKWKILTVWPRGIVFLTIYFLFSQMGWASFPPGLCSIYTGSSLPVSLLIGSFLI